MQLTPEPRLLIAPRRVLATARDVARAGVASAPEAGTPHRLVAIEDVWIVTEDGAWVVAYRLALQGGRLVIGELRVYPHAPDVQSTHAATGRLEWIPGPRPRPWDDRRLLGLEAPVPVGGLSSSLVHRIKPASDVNTVGRLILHTVRDAHPWLWTRLKDAGVVSAAAPRPDASHHMGGPRGRGIAFYRRVAAVYNTAPRQPVKAVRKAFPDLSPSAASAAIFRARHQYRLLPPTSRGRAAARNYPTAFAVQRSATGGGTGGRKTPQVQAKGTKKARQSTGRTRRG